MRSALAAFALGMTAALVGAACGEAASPSVDAPRVPAADAPAGMAWVPTRTFTMGWDGHEARPDEQPAHAVTVSGFWIDRTEVTNARFAEFVEATGHVTTAERPVDWDALAEQLPPGTPKPPAEQLAPGSLVFTPPPAGASLDDPLQWWRWVPGAIWRHPEGPGSDLEGRAQHPVVHVSWDDARAYAAWAGKRLPTEAEWESAARYGHDGARFPWGDELQPGGAHRANIWQGDFPVRDTAADGFAGTAPVGSFPPNPLGVHDLAGNVWEWTADQFRPDTYRQRLDRFGADGGCVDPRGPSTTLDPRNPFASRSYVHKGGSFLCHGSYCASYRPSAKMAATPDSSWNHLGFRCVSDAPPPAE